MRNQPTVVQRMTGVGPDDCSVSAITSYELFTGVEKCQQPARERAKVELLLKTLRQLPFDEPSAREAWRLRAFFESRGMTIGPYDILLAGHAIAAGLTLVSANTAEFGRVPGLTLENWELPIAATSP